MYSQDPKRRILLSSYKKLRQVTDHHLKREKEQEVAKENDLILERINRIYNRKGGDEGIGTALTARRGSMKRLKS